MKEEMATQKQYEYAREIANTLDVQLPVEFTKEAYSKFISHYKDEYEKFKYLYVDEDDEEYYEEKHQYSWERTR